MYRRLVIVLFFLLLLASAGLVHADIETTQHTLTYDGIERTYHVYEPEGEASRILIALHDFASSGKAMEVVTGLNAVADEYGFIVVYPDAAGYYWDDGRVEYGLEPSEGSVDDMGFLAALRDELIATYHIEPAHVYLTGIGNGGHMAYTAACLQPESFGGVVVVSTLLWDYHQSKCSQNANPSPIDVLILHGTRDAFYQSESHQLEISGGLHFIMGANDTLSFWSERNQCDSDTLTTTGNISSYSDCSVTTALVEIEGSGGQWARIDDSVLNQFGVDASAIIGAFISGADWQALTEPTEATADTLPRTFRLFVPNSYDFDTPTPLVIGLHGRGGTANHHAWISDFNSIAKREGFITLYPEGIENQWNYIRGLPEGFEGTGSHDDNEFINALVDDVSQSLNIDSNRIYVMGYSNGGFMTQRIACLEPDRYAAFASVAATGTYGLTHFCEDTTPVPMLYIHGTADRIVPWEGQQMQDAGGNSFYISMPMTQTMSFWAFHNGCVSDDINIEDLPQSNPATQTRILEAIDCLDYAPVTLYMVMRGGHVWHGVREVTNPMLGIASEDFNASEVIWEFFAQHSLDDRP